MPTNIREPDQVADVLRDAVYGRFGRVDALVNNGWPAIPGPAQHDHQTGWRAVVDLNLNGTWSYEPLHGPDGGGGLGLNRQRGAHASSGALMFVHSGAARGVVNMVRS